MHKQTILDQIEITNDGTIGLRFAKQVIDDDGSIMSSAWHRTMLPPGQDIDLQMGVVNAHLERDLNYPRVDEAQLNTLRAIAPLVWTDDVKRVYQEKLAAQSAAKKDA